MWGCEWMMQIGEASLQGFIAADMIRAISTWYNALKLWRFGSMWSPLCAAADLRGQIELKGIARPAESRPSWMDANGSRH